MDFYYDDEGYGVTFADGRGETEYETTEFYCLYYESSGDVECQWSITTYDDEYDYYETYYSCINGVCEEVDY
jgi:hypothetical protein